MHSERLRVVMSSSNSLFLQVVILDPFGIVHLVVKLLLSVVTGMNSTEVVGAPHLIGVKLIRASEFVLVRLAVNAVKERVSSFEAKFLVVHHLLGVSNRENFDIRHVRHSFLLY